MQRRHRRKIPARRRPLLCRSRGAVARAEGGRRRLARRAGRPGLRAVECQRHAGRRQRLPDVFRQPAGPGQAAQVPAARLLRGPARAVPPRILPPAGRRPPYRPQAHAAGAADAVRHRHPRLRAALHHGRGRAPGPRRDPLQGQVPRDPAAARAVQPPCALVPPPRRSGGPGVHGARRAAARAHHGLENAEGPVRAGRRGERQGLPAQPAPPVRQDLLRRRKNLSKLADLLGHSSVETTRIYIMESGAEHQKLLERMHLLL